MLAAEKSSLEAMECLLEVGAQVDQVRTDCLLPSDHPVVIITSLTVGLFGQTDTFGETALIHAARAAAHPAIRFLLDAKADLNKMDK